MSNSMNGNVVAGQQSQYISIVPENGEQFVAGQKIIYNIEPEIGYIKKDSYICFDVINTSTQQNRMCFPRGVGAHALIENVNIYSKETGVLLESLQNYSQWRVIEHQYLNDDPSQLALKEGCGVPHHSYNFHNGSSTPQNVFAGASDIENNVLSPIDKTCVAKYTAVRFCIPLKTGLMGHMDNDPKLIPILNFGGLRIEITLAKAPLALQNIGASFNQTPNTVANINGAGDGRETVVYDLASQGVRLCPDNTGGDGTYAHANTVHICIVGTNVASIADLGLAVGNKIVLNESSTLTASDRTPVADEDTGSGYLSTRKITAIAYDGGNITVNGITKALTVKLTLDGALSAFTSANGGKQHWALLDQSGIGYKIAKTEFRLLQVSPPADVMNTISKGINYEFTSYDTFLDNVPTSSLRHQIPIHSVASKAISMFTHLYDSSSMENQSHQNYYYGLPPESSKVNDVVWFVNNRLYPLRSYNPQSNKDKVLTLNELNKALQAIGKSPVNLGDNEFGNLSGYSNTFLLCRELAREGFVFDLRNAEPEVRLSFSGARTSILRANTFVFSKRIVQTSAQGVQVVY